MNLNFFFIKIAKVARGTKKAFWPPRFVRSCGERPLCLAPIAPRCGGQADCRCGIAQKSSLASRQETLGFTLIELLIVITILAVLTGVALLDYGFSVKKARIQVAAEELVALLGDATVRSQTQFSQIEEVDGADSTVVCYGVTIEKGSLPVLFKTSRDEDTQLCVMSDREPVKELSWEDLVFVTDIDWTAMTVSGTETDTVDWIAFLFSPPKGDVSVYLDSGLLVEKSEVTEVQVRLTYQNSSESVLNKVVKINPVTSSFMILTQSEVEAL